MGEGGGEAFELLAGVRICGLFEEAATGDGESLEGLVEVLPEVHDIGQELSASEWVVFIRDSDFERRDKGGCVAAALVDGAEEEGGVKGFAVLGEEGLEGFDGG